MASRAYLLDTNAFLWSGGNSSRLSEKVLSVLSDRKVKRYVSVGSVWEMQVKHAQGKLPLPEKADKIASRFAAEIQADLLDIQAKHIAGLYRLPLVHRDPFDRILVAQAITEGLTLISSDQVFRAYPVQVLW